MPVLIVILAWPMIEIALFILVGGWIGLWPTLALVVAAGVAGVLVLRDLGGARVPLRREGGLAALLPVAEEAARMLAALLLIVPGFLSDAVAIVLLVPPLRRALIAALGRRIAGRAPAASVTIIEGDYVDLDDPPPVTPPRPLSRH